MEKIEIMHGGTMRFWGEWFGRPMDNYHQVTNAVYDQEEDVLTMTFADGEICMVYSPRDMVSSKQEFYIRDAKRVIWSRYTSDKGGSAIRLIQTEYVKECSDLVVCTSVGYWDGGIRKIIPTGYYAVEII